MMKGLFILLFLFEWKGYNYTCSLEMHTFAIQTRKGHYISLSFVKKAFYIQLFYIQLRYITSLDKGRMRFMFF